MSKNYKQKHNKNIEETEITTENNNNLSKKELYDLKQQEKRKEKEKLAKKNKNKSSKKKSTKKTYKINLAGRIFAIVMLLLMTGSILATISIYFTSGS